MPTAMRTARPPPRAPRAVGLTLMDAPWPARSPPPDDICVLDASEKSRPYGRPSGPCPVMLQRAPRHVSRPCAGCRASVRPRARVLLGHVVRTSEAGRRLTAGCPGTSRPARATSRRSCPRRIRPGAALRCGRVRAVSSETATWTRSHSPPLGMAGGWGTDSRGMDSCWRRPWPGAWCPASLRSRRRYAARERGRSCREMRRGMHGARPWGSGAGRAATARHPLRSGVRPTVRPRRCVARLGLREPAALARRLLPRHARVRRHVQWAEPTGARHGRRIRRLRPPLLPVLHGSRAVRHGG